MKQKQLLFLLALLMTAATGAWAQTGMTNGSFSVSATKRVHFSKGNLQLVGENTFQFAENQWDVFGSSQSNGHRDLFGWGSANNPNLTSENNNDYSTFTDWGTKIGDGTTWRTLTNDEWNYVLNTRTASTLNGTENARYAYATVNGVGGLILFPDNYTHPGTVAAPTKINTPSTAFSANTYNGDDWLAMEDAGAVFLPHGGCRTGSSYQSNQPNYWSSTPISGTMAHGLNLSPMEFKSWFRFRGCAVRLVTDGYVLTLADGTQDAKNWTIASGENSVKGDVAYGLTGLNEDDAVTLTYNGRLKVKSVTATTDAELVTLATPLTVEAITAGTIQVNTNGTLSTGMKYSVNGGTKTTITETTTIEGLKAGDKVQFYSNGTGNTAYSNDPEVNISGGTAEVKAYGNIMSLLAEEGFATKTDLPNYAFLGLFMVNTTLIDASELLLPAATLAPCCYQQMFQGCTSLTKAPKLPATTLDQYCYSSMFSGCTSLTAAPELPAATWLAACCYLQMFQGCTSLTSAYVKAAYKNESAECYNMFYGCTATDAVLHTTSGNKASWEGVMGTGKEWENWTVAGDWQE